jgi:hypothetical protein
MWGLYHKNLLHSTRIVRKLSSKNVEHTLNFSTSPKGMKFYWYGYNYKGSLKHKWHISFCYFWIQNVWTISGPPFLPPVIGNKQKTNSVAFSLQANYTDWATAIGRRILVPTFVDRGISLGQRGGSPTAVNLSLLDRSRYFFFQVAPHLSSRDWVGSVPDSVLLRKCSSAGNRTRDLCDCRQKLWPLDHSKNVKKVGK